MLHGLLKECRIGFHIFRGVIGQTFRFFGNNDVMGNLHMDTQREHASVSLVAVDNGTLESHFGVFWPAFTEVYLHRLLLRFVETNVPALFRQHIS